MDLLKAKNADCLGCKTTPKELVPKNLFQSSKTTTEQKPVFPAFGRFTNTTTEPPTTLFGPAPENTITKEPEKQKTAPLKKELDIPPPSRKIVCCWCCNKNGV